MIFYFNYSAVMIFACILLGIFARGMTKGRTNRIYILMVVLSIIATFCDFLPYWFHYPLSKWDLLLANVINYGYFITRNLCIFLYILFLFSVSRTWY
ncbi:MAG: hypothetical protein K5675_00085, partial [Lachnospiraceae bacterium]|nr:hypothetical protein [Lachnospiraceae bacterium]